jgi:hypothetical protein
VLSAGETQDVVDRLTQLELSGATAFEAHVRRLAGKT